MTGCELWRSPSKNENLDPIWQALHRQAQVSEQGAKTGKKTRERSLEEALFSNQSDFLIEAITWHWLHLTLLPPGGNHVGK